MKLEKVQRALEKLDKEKEEALRKKLQVIRRQLVDCKKCGKKSQLGTWSFIQEHWYELPHSCTGGDNWWPSETRLCNIICPKCGQQNYIFNHPRGKEIVELIDEQASEFSKQKIFKRVGDRYTGHGGSNQIKFRT